MRYELVIRRREKKRLANLRDDLDEDAKVEVNKAKKKRMADLRDNLDDVTKVKLNKAE